MSLVADYSGSSSESSFSDSEHKEKPETQITSKPGKTELKLPSAKAVLSTTTKATGMVFSNPFLEAELAETATLEKHVKMVNNDEHLLQKNGRKICWNYRKGRCRFGTSCVYAHDSDLNESGDSKISIEPVESPTGNLQLISDVKPIKRSRPGLSDAVDPSKRVMKNYFKHSRREN